MSIGLCSPFIKEHIFYFSTEQKASFTFSWHMLFCSQNCEATLHLQVAVFVDSQDPDSAAQDPQSGPSGLHGDLPVLSDI